MKTKRGDVILALFPDSNLQTSKRRPALVVQAENLKTGLSQTIVAMITSNLSRAGHRSRVLLTASSIEGKRAGLKTDSVVMTDNLATILDVEIVRVIGSLDVMEAIDDALSQTLGI